MTTRSIGGALDMRALGLLYGAVGRRNDHRPSDRDTLRAAATELASRGLQPRDIGQSLGLTESAVRQLLEREAA